MSKSASFRSSISGRNSKSIPGDDFEYARRCAYWLEKSKERPKNFRVRRRDRRPIALAGHGVSLRVDRGTLLIKDGHTHFPQERTECRLFRGDINLPSQILMLDASGSLSLDVLEWLSEQGISLLQLNWRGEIVSVSGQFGYGANPKLVAAQIVAHQTGKAAKIARWLISEKLKNSIDTLRRYAPEGRAKVRAREYSEAQARLLSKSDNLPHALLGSEANSAALYFGAFLGMPLNWKNAKLIPADWMKVGSRLSAITNKQRGARHPVNAMLNYGYTISKGLVRTQIIAEGMDPTIGVMHRMADRKREDLVFDLVEPMRPVVDQIVFGLVREEAFWPSDFHVAKDGICRLSPQLARIIVRRVEVEAVPAMRLPFRRALDSRHVAPNR